MLWSLAYLALCRLFALVVLLCRSDRSKELEILVLRHQLAILRRQGRKPQARPFDRVLLAALSHALPRSAWLSADAPALARPARRAPLDVPTQAARAATARPSDPRARAAARA